MKTPFIFLAIGALATSLFSQTGTNTLLIQAGPNGNPANTQVKANQPTLSYAVVKIYPNGAPAGAFIKKITNSGYALLLNYSSTPLISRWKAGVLTNLDQSTSQENSSEDINNDGTVIGVTSTSPATWSASSTSPAPLSLNWSWKKGVYNYSLVNPYSTTSPEPSGFFFINDSGAILGNAMLYAYPDSNTNSYGMRFSAFDTFFWSSPGAVPVRKGDFYYAWPRQSRSGTDTPAAGKYFHFPMSLNNDNVWVAYAMDASQPNAIPFQSLSTTSQPLDFYFSDMSDGTSPRLVGETYWWQAGNKNSLSALGIKRAYKINNQYDIVAEDNTGATTLLKLDLVPNTPLASQSNYKSVGLSLPFGWENPKIADLNDNRLLSALVDYVPYSSSGAANGPIQKAQPVILVPAELAVDANRDGVITLSRESTDPALSDKTSQTKPYRFWSNDDIDRVHTFSDSAADTMAEVNETEEDDIGPEEARNELMQADCWTNNKADSKRDLEDFTRLQIYTAGLNDSFKNGQLFLGLKWTNVTGEPAIRVYKQHEATGALSYLTDDTEATAQMAEYAIRDARYQNESASVSLHAMVHGSDVFILPTSLFANLSEAAPKTHLLFEGVKTGKGQLKLVILKQENGNYTEIGEGPGLWMDLKKIADMYEHWSVGNGNGAVPDAIAGRVASETSSGPAFSYDSASPEEKKYILFIHGWNMEKWEKERFAETAYKRLWWQGYKGRFGLFSWPTTNNFAGGAIQGLMDGTNFDRGEYSAWRSGAPLRQLMQTLNSAYGGKLYVFSHSMGGVVTSEALRLQSDAGGGHIASVYVASQAALSVHCYDGTLSEAAGSPDAVQWTYNHPSLHLGLQNYGPQTPNIYRNWTAYVLGGSATSTSAVGSLVNFYNVNDWALAAPAWHFNQITKPDYPDPSNPFTYEYNGTPDVFGDVFHKMPSTGAPIALHLGTRTAPEDRYEIMSFAAESRVRSFGATPHLSQGVSGLVDLQQLDGWDTDGGANKAHKWHSAQFRSTIIRQRDYWKTLLGQNGFNILLTPALP